MDIVDSNRKLHAFYMGHWTDRLILPFLIQFYHMSHKKFMSSFAWYFSWSCLKTVTSSLFWVLSYNRDLPLANSRLQHKCVVGFHTTSLPYRFEACWNHTITVDSLSQVCVCLSVNLLVSVSKTTNTNMKSNIDNGLNYGNSLFRILETQTSKIRGGLSSLFADGTISKKERPC